VAASAERANKKIIPPGAGRGQNAGTGAVTASGAHPGASVTEDATQATLGAHLGSREGWQAGRATCSRDPAQPNPAAQPAPPTPAEGGSDGAAPQHWQTRAEAAMEATYRQPVGAGGRRRRQGRRSQGKERNGGREPGLEVRMGPFFFYYLFFMTKTWTAVVHICLPSVYPAL